MKYFIDNCLSFRFAQMLGALERGEVTSLRTHFPQDTADEDWIPEVGRNGWVLISIDRHQLRKPEQREALRAAGAIAFYMAKTFDSLKFMDQAWRLVKYWPAIVDAAERTRTGQCYLVRANGAIEVLPP